MAGDSKVPTVRVIEILEERGAEMVIDYLGKKGPELHEAFTMKTSFNRSSSKKEADPEEDQQW